jgi:outer membrane protein W
MFKTSFFTLIFLLPLLAFSAENKGFYVVGDAGSTELSAPSNSTTSVSVTSNSYNLGLGYEVDKWSVEYTLGSAAYVSSTVGTTTSTVELTNWTLVANYKILNTGNFKPYIGIGRYGGTINLTGYSSEDYSRNIWNAGVEIPLDTTSSLRVKYFKSFEVTGYAGFSGFSAGLMYRF